MAKKALPKYIVITDKENDTEYKLGYTRRVILDMESDGFNINEIDSKPLAAMNMLFTRSFDRFHPEVSLEKREEIYDELGDKSELMLALVDLWSYTVEGLTSNQNTRLKWKMV